METYVFSSEEKCWKCGDELVRLQPALYGWWYYCQRCKHMTMPAWKAEQALNQVGREAIGTLVAISVDLKIEPVVERG